MSQEVNEGATVIGTDIPVADVIAKDDQDIRLLLLCIEL
jgi:hypothetical protein